MAPRSAHRAFAMASAGLLAVAVLHAAIPHEGIHAALAQAGSFLEPFTGAPPAPIPFILSNWDVNIDSLDPSTWKQLEPMEAGHGANCSAPPAQHHLSGNYADSVFICNDHMMTAINAGGGYGAIYLTPNQQIDFSGGEAVLKFDISTLQTSGRDWVDLWVTPFADNLTSPLEDWLPDFQGEPRRAVHVRMNNGVHGPFFQALVIDGHAVRWEGGNDWLGVNFFLTPSAVRRDTVEVRLSRTHVRVGMPAYGINWVDSAISDLGWTRGVVQFGHHSYNPTKECTPSGTLTCQANTWHWDNVSISPSVPFTMLKASRRFSDATSLSAVSFPSPAPSGAFLRFSGIGSALEVSTNGGASWTPAVRQAQEKNFAEHFSAYWMPIAAGTQAVQFRGQSAGPITWFVRDIAIWAEGGGASGSTVTPTSTPVSMPTATTTPTATPALCEVNVRIAGVERWLVKPAAFCQ